MEVFLREHELPCFGAFGMVNMAHLQIYPLKLVIFNGDVSYVKLPEGSRPSVTFLPSCACSTASSLSKRVMALSMPGGQRPLEMMGPCEWMAFCRWSTQSYPRLLGISRPWILWPNFKITMLWKVSGRNSCSDNQEKSRV